MKNEITFKENGNITIFSCGCKTEVIGDNFFMSPCSGECEVFKYCMEVSRKQGNIISIIDEKDGR